MYLFDFIEYIMFLRIFFKSWQQRCFIERYIDTNTNLGVCYVSKYRESRAVAQCNQYH